jgi:hypothetical protein
LPGLALRRIPIRSILIADLRALPVCSRKQHPTIPGRIFCAEQYWDMGLLSVHGHFCAPRDFRQALAYPFGVK